MSENNTALKMQQPAIEAQKRMSAEGKRLTAEHDRRKPEDARYASDSAAELNRAKQPLRSR